MVYSESDEESVRNPMSQFHFVPIKQVQGWDTNSCKYNEGNVTDVCLKYLMKPYRTFILIFG